MWLEETLQLRIRDTEMAQIQYIMEKYHNLYDNVSHFVRCAIIRHLKNYKDELSKQARDEVVADDKGRG